MKDIGRLSSRTGGERLTPTTHLSLYLLLFVLCVVTYHGVTDNFFFNDDFLWLRDARHEMTLENVWSYRVIGFFRPLVNLSFFLSERISSGDILFYHWINLLLHFGNCVLVFLLLRNLLGEPLTAAVAAALFAVTSVHNGAVFWVSARTTLLSSLLLLGSLALLTRRDRGGLLWPLLLFVLALTAKETAVVGAPLVALIFLCQRSARTRQTVSGSIVAAFTLITAAYFLLRIALMGQFFQDNWTVGPHILRNLAGGFLYQLYPWPLFSFVLHSAGHFPDPQRLVWLELLVAPVLLLLFWLGRRTGRLQPMVLAVGWSLLSLLPASLFTYRFFSTASMTQNRYYYLSSVGSVLILALLLCSIWRARIGWRRGVAAGLLLFLCLGYMVRVDVLEKRWDKFTHNYQRVVSIVLDEVRGAPPVTTLAIEGAPMEFQYLEGALEYLHPEWEVHAVAGGIESAARWAPCLYISFELEPGMLNVSSTMVE